MKLLCSRKTPLKGVSPNQGSYRILFSEKIEDLAEEWSSFCVADNLMDVPFLKTIEDFHSPSIKPFYALVISDEKTVGLLYFQVKNFHLAKSLHFECTDSSAFEKFSVFLKKKFAGYIRFNTLVMGNLLLTGEYGYKFSPQYSSVSDRINFINSINDLPSDIIRYAQQEALIFARKVFGTDCRAILCKDFGKEDDHLKLREDGFYKIEVQPDMVFEIRPEWKSFDDYLESLESKYRVRYRRARKKLGTISKRNLTTSELITHLPKIHELYLNIVKNAGFNLFYLSGDFFVALKENLGTNFSVDAYFSGNELVGFSSIIKNFNYQYCFFLGYDTDSNKENQLYLNMLYDFIEGAINQHMSHIIMSRTAIEIKSSVGAIPEEKFVYFKHRNTFVHAAFKFLFSWMYKNKEWQLRSPFKNS